MVVFGIDPGYATVGYGAVRLVRGRCEYLTHGVITTRAGVEHSRRLGEIFEDLESLLREVRPDAVAIESLFFNTNQKTAIDVAQARGVLVLACARAGYVPCEYTPLQVKMAVVGYGRAHKKQMQEMTRVLLSLESAPKPDDAADALAVAICHAITAGGAAAGKSF